MTITQAPILLVEDTLTQAMLMQHMLEAAGYTVKLARNARAALDWLKEHRPAIVLSDVNMPEIDGYELCRLTKSDPDLRDIPFVILAALVEPSEIVKLLECGADNFIVKSYRSEVFLACLQSILRNCSETYPLAKSTVLIRLPGTDRQLQTQPQLLANLLKSAFETAVFGYSLVDTAEEQLHNA